MKKGMWYIIGGIAVVGVSVGAYLMYKKNSDAKKLSITSDDVAPIQNTGNVLNDAVAIIDAKKGQYKYDFEMAEKMLKGQEDSLSSFSADEIALAINRWGVFYSQAERGGTPEKHVIKSLIWGILNQSELTEEMTDESKESLKKKLYAKYGITATVSRAWLDKDKQKEWTKKKVDLLIATSPLDSRIVAMRNTNAI